MTSADDHALAQADDEITIDPEATNAADANWLADLRAKARADGRSMAELLTDDPASAEVETDGLDDEHLSWLDDADDEVTIDHRGQRDEIRQAVKQSRANDSVQSAPPDAPQPAANQTVAPPLHPTSPPLAPTEPLVRSPDLSAGQPARGEPTRWEAPPRLSTGRQDAPPALLTSTSTSRRLDWRIVAAIVAAVVLGFAIAILISGGSDDEPVEDPSVSSVDAPPEADLESETEQP